MKVPFIDLSYQHIPIKEEILAEIVKVMDSEQYILGEYVKNFEQKCSKYCNVKYAIGVSSGTDALLVALYALGVGKGDAVITSSFTFFATAGSICRTGATPVFADIDPVTFNISASSIEKILKTKERLKNLKPKVIIPVHLFGQCADMGPIIDIAQRYGLSIVEDAAQSFGSGYPFKSRIFMAGTMGDIGCFSFFPTKNLGGMGDGGLVVTNSKKLARCMESLRNHGQHKKPYVYYRIGGNFRLDAIQAAVLDVKIEYVDLWRKERQKNAELYNKYLKDTGIKLPVTVYPSVENGHVYNQYVIRVKNRHRVREELSKRGIGTAVYYPVPLHLQPCFRSLGYSRGELPESEKAAREVLALPIYPGLTEEKIKYICDNLIDILNNAINRR